MKARLKPLWRRIFPPGSRRADQARLARQWFSKAARPLTALAQPFTQRVRKRQVAAQQALVEDAIRLQNRQPVILFLPSVPWSLELFQRPQQLALALAKAGALVLYLQPPEDFEAEPLQAASPGVLIASLPVEAFWNLEQPWVYTLSWNSQPLLGFRSPRVIYDYIDDTQVFFGDQAQIRRDHQRLLQNARVVLATAERLYEEVKAQRPDVLFSPNGADYAHFASVRKGGSSAGSPLPVDLIPLFQIGRPIVGYYGALARWFDGDLLREVACLRPNLTFVLIGPFYDSTLKSTGLLDLPNLHYLGAKPYAEIPSYLRSFDVAMIPFRLNEITHATSPLKLFEYMAGGKPVVVTPMRESLRYPGVLAGKDAAEFAARLDQALQLKDDPAYLAVIDEVARQNTWEARASQLLAALEKAPI